MPFRDGNFAPPLLTSPHVGFPHPAKVVWGGVGMGQDFSPAPRGKTGMGLDFLDPPCLVPSHPRPTPRC